MSQSQLVTWIQVSMYIFSSGKLICRRGKQEKGKCLYDQKDEKKKRKTEKGGSLLVLRAIGLAATEIYAVAVRTSVTDKYDQDIIR